MNVNMNNYKVDFANINIFENRNKLHLSFVHRQQGGEGGGGEGEW